MKNSILILDNARVLDARVRSQMQYKRPDMHITVKFSITLKLVFTGDRALVDSTRAIKNIL